MAYTRLLTEGDGRKERRKVGEENEAKCDQGRRGSGIKKRTNTKMVGSHSS